MNNNSTIQNIARVCIHCKEDVAIRNPTGWCDHLHYPEYCSICGHMIQAYDEGFEKGYKKGREDEQEQ